LEGISVETRPIVVESIVETIRRINEKDTTILLDEKNAQIG